MGKNKMKLKTFSADLQYIIPLKCMKGRGRRNVQPDEWTTSHNYAFKYCVV
jgi:hypothetical protein